jgi:beta-glucosidase
VSSFADNDPGTPQTKETAMDHKLFPKDFLWGAATSSYQIEGATQQDGRAPSIWDQFCAEPGRIKDGSDGRHACEHYRLWKDDVRLMKELGLQAYRFSIAWPRVLPHGKGPLNEKGLQFYDRLVDELLANDIEPWVTLYHWDLPSALGDRGGWLNRDVAEHFAEYARIMVQRLGDRVKHWITHNEPWCVAVLGYRIGEHAPGIRDPRSSWQAAHHVLLSHGLAMQAMRSEASELIAGITLNLNPAYPASASLIDQAAARDFDGSFNRWYLDPVFRGTLPADMLPKAESECGPKGLDFIHPRDLQTIQQPMDFLGINYYSRAIVRGAEQHPEQLPITLHRNEQDLTDMNWEVAPEGLSALLERVHTDYQPHAIYVTENGAAYADSPGPDGRIRDARRTKYLAQHFSAMQQAMEQGVPLRGYFLWSLFDNFEWAHGYEKRFGIIWVDYATQKRILKDSARWYSRVIATRDPSIRSAYTSQASSP